MHCVYGFIVLTHQHFFEHIHSFDDVFIQFDHADSQSKFQIVTVEHIK